MVLSKVPINLIGISLAVLGFAACFGDVPTGFENRVANAREPKPSLKLTLARR